MNPIPTSQSPIPGLATVASFFRLTVDEYHEMIRNNILTTEARVELLDGYLVNQMPQNTPNGSTVDRLTEDLNRVKPAGWRVRIQLPITLAKSEPEPDAAVVRGDRRAFDKRNPGSADFGIVIEVADSSLALDRGPKAALYAQSGIPVYWIVNILKPPDRGLLQPRSGRESTRLQHTHRLHHRGNDSRRARWQHRRHASRCGTHPVIRPS
ncbi:MAG: Uma2 family endonuclease [Gemmataceae bacterium]